MNSASPHISVMLNEVLETLSPTDGEVYVDGTFGAGGYTRAILQAADCVVLAIDRDPAALKVAEEFKQEFGERFVFLRGCFGDVKALLQDAGYDQVNGFVLDIGVSSMQIDQAGRGFSFKNDGPLDMRMDTQNGETAADIVNTYAQDDLANLIYKYGEERKSRRIAQKIVERREEQPFETTRQLAEVVAKVLPKSGHQKTDPATRTFQALRIAVNDELGELGKALKASPEILKEGGRLVVVSFHSLEDGLVKQTLREQSGRIEGGSRHLPPQVNNALILYTLPKAKALKPTQEEINLNPRSRSARAHRSVDGGGEMKTTFLSYLMVYGAVVFMGIALINTGQKVQMMEREIRTYDRKIEKEKEAIKTLKAEWAYLNTPARLENLAEKAFGMHAPEIKALDGDVDSIPSETHASIIFKIPKQKPKPSLLQDANFSNAQGLTISYGGAQ